MAERKSQGKRTLLHQVDDIPEEFKQRFFNVPISVRIERNEQFLGDARIIVSVDESIELLDFTDIAESAITPKERQVWGTFLKQKRRLGACTEDCPLDLIMLHYSLENSVLSLVTKYAERDGVTRKYHEVLPDGGQGAILHNSINLINAQGQKFSGVYTLDAHASLGKWSVIAGFRAEQSAAAAAPELMRHLYLEQELPDHFLRAGYFYPEARGVSRQPGNLGGRDTPMLGFMLGSSDVLALQAPAPSLYPVTITAHRPGIVEIYRNGRLLHTQALQAGLQTLDTTRLPAGIYSVDVHVIEAGHVVARSMEQIYKPMNWSNPAQHWRYNVFMGTRDAAMRGRDANTGAHFTLGGSVDYLLHPRAVVALSAQKYVYATALGAAIDWNFLERSKLYASLSRSGRSGAGFETQAVFDRQDTSVVFNHLQTWLDRSGDASQNAGARLYQESSAKSSVSVYRFLNPRTSVNLQLSHSRGRSRGVGLDFGVSHAQRIQGNDAQWRLALFRRPENAWNGRARSVGIDLTMHLSFGKEGKNLSASLGSRAAAYAGREQYAGLAYAQNFQERWLNSVSATVMADRYGANLSAGGRFKQDSAHGNFYLQRSSLNGAISTGLNMDSTLAVGAGKFAATGAFVAANSAGIIVDVDADLAELTLRAEDSEGNSTPLKPGRNFVPVAPYRAGTLQFDLAYDEQHAATIAPDMASYHLNRGGVAYQRIRAMHVMAVLGRLVDRQGMPLRGARIVNHAGSSVSEADGHFTLNISQAEPVLEVRQQDVLLCTLRIAQHQHRQEGDLLLLGNLPCVAAGTAAMQAALPREARP